jgi:hypothetical protein
MNLDSSGDTFDEKRSLFDVIEEGEKVPISSDRRSARSDVRLELGLGIRKSI